MWLKIFNFIIGLLFVFTVSAQKDTTSNTLHYTDFTYKQNLHTPQLYKKGWLLSAPVIKLNSDEQLHLAFDDFSEDVNTYSIRFVHCDQNWQPSPISIADYQDGFDYEDLVNYDYSFNTLQSYIHFTYDFPNENIQLTKSGNYLLIIYQNHDEDNLVLTRRFYITENTVMPKVTVKPTSLPMYNKTHQEMEITIDVSSLKGCYSPESQIYLQVTQNHRPYFLRKNFKPALIKDKLLIYRYSDSLIFKGNNEFRYFDTKSIRYQSEFIQAIKYQAPLYHIYLYADESRLFKPYVFYKDLNGRYYPEIQEGRDNPVEADYVWVHFSLNYPTPLTDGAVYITGQMNDWILSSQTKMTYDYNSHQYTKDLLLKQGYYNYCYTFLKDSTSCPDDYLFEDSYSDTENDYTVYVYYKSSSEFYIRLVGVQTVNTLQKQQ